MDYNQLIASKSTPGSIAAWLNNSTIQNDVPEIILEAESWIYRRLRHWRMLTPISAGTMTIGLDYLTLPSDLLEPFSLFLTGAFNQEIIQRTPQEVIGAYAYTSSDGVTYTRSQGTPTIYYFDQTAIRFDCPSNQAYSYGLVYFQQPPSLASTTTNFLTQFYPRLLRAAIMISATEWTKESGTGTIDRTYWVQVAQDEIEKAQQESDRAKRGTVAGGVIIGGGGGSRAYGWASA